MRFQRLIFVFLLSLFFGSSTWAQLRFTKADIEPTFAEGSMTDYTATNAEGLAFNLGSKGGGNTWDFTVFQYTSAVYERNLIDPVLTPYADDFPDATHASVSGDTELTYAFFKLDDTGLYMLGVGSEMSSVPFLMVYNPPQPELKFPLELGTKWSYKGDPVSPLEGFTQETEMSIEVISSGTLITPAGSHAALCLKNVSKMTQRFEIGGQVLSEGYTTSTEIMFMTKNGVNASLSVDSTDSDSMLPHLTDASYSVDDGTTSVEPLAAAPGFEFDAVWPNPLNSGGDLNISWKQVRASSVEISLHDMLGRKVRSVFAGQSAEGRHALTVPASDLPSGVYLLRSSAEGQKSAQQRFTILR